MSYIPYADVSTLNDLVPSVIELPLFLLVPAATTAGWRGSGNVASNDECGYTAR